MQEMQRRLLDYMEKGGSLVHLVSETKIPMPGIKALENGDASLLDEDDLNKLNSILPADQQSKKNTAQTPQVQTSPAPTAAPHENAQANGKPELNPMIPTRGQLMRLIGRRLFARNWGGKNVKFTWTNNESQLQLVFKTGLATTQNGREEKFTIHGNARLEVWEMQSGRHVKDWTSEFAWNARADKILSQIAEKIDELCPLIIFRPKCPRCKMHQHLTLAIRPHNEDNQYWLCGDCGYWESLNGGSTKFKSERKMRELESQSKAQTEHQKEKKSEANPSIRQIPTQEPAAPAAAST